MKLKDYLAEMNKLIAEHPEALEFQVIYSSDEEGNEFNNNYNAPTIGRFNGTDFMPHFDGIKGRFKSDAVCLN